MFKKMLLALLCGVSVSGVHAASQPSGMQPSGIQVPSVDPRLSDQATNWLRRKAISAAWGVGYAALTVGSLRMTSQVLKSGPARTETGTIARLVAVACGGVASIYGFTGFCRSVKELFGTPDLSYGHDVNVTIRQESTSQLPTQQN